MASRLRRWKRKLTRANWFLQLLGFLAHRLIQLYLKTLRIEIILSPEFKALSQGRYLLGFWHDQQFLLVATGHRWPAAIMVDTSWAGNIQAHILRYSGHTPIFGSTKHNPSKALISMKKAIEAGQSGAFALDGPHGPKHKAKAGILFLAQKLDVPIIPVATAANRYWQIPNTWCDYQLPLPFARCRLLFGKPIWEASQIKESMSAYTVNDLNQAMEILSQQCSMIY